MDVLTTSELTARGVSTGNFASGKRNENTRGEATGGKLEGCLVCPQYRLKLEKLVKATVCRKSKGT